MKFLKKAKEIFYHSAVKMDDLTVYLDLDSTFVHSYFEEEEIEEIENFLQSDIDPSLRDRIYKIELVDSQDNSIKGIGEVESFYMILRPYTDDFLEFLACNCKEIHIWSAGQFRYVKSVVHVLFNPRNKKLKQLPKNILSRVHCDIGKDYVLKDLNEHHRDLSKVLIIDDRDDTFQNNIDNGIHIPVYAPDITIENFNRDDKTLLELKEWFRSLNRIKPSDIRNVPKDDIFHDYINYIDEDDI